LPKILENNIEVIGYIESIVRSRADAYLVARGDNVPLWRVQKEFDPVVTVREYEVPTRGLFPVRIRFEYTDTQNKGAIKINRKGLLRLKEMIPDVFESVSDKEDAEVIDVTPPVKQPKTTPERAAS